MKKFNAGNAEVQVYSSQIALGAAAARRATSLICSAIEKRKRARIIVATGNSQISLANALVTEPIPWQAVDVFHMDEYVNIDANHPSSFRYWVRTRIKEKVSPGSVHYLNGDAPDLDSETRRYSVLLTQFPIDLAFVGFGENGHIAFNDPGAADFNDPAVVKRVTLDDICRNQQAGEGHFKDLASVPQQAVTITCSGLFRASSWICCVPEARKASAVRNALEGPISESCPASIVRKHGNAVVYLDRESSSLLHAANRQMSSKADLSELR